MLGGLPSIVRSRSGLWFFLVAWLGGVGGDLLLLLMGCDRGAVVAILGRRGQELETGSGGGGSWDGMAPSMDAGSDRMFVEIACSAWRSKETSTQQPGPDWERSIVLSLAIMCGPHQVLHVRFELQSPKIKSGPQTWEEIYGQRRIASGYVTGSGQTSWRGGHGNGEGEVGHGLTRVVDRRSAGPQARARPVLYCMYCTVTITIHDPPMGSPLLRHVSRVSGYRGDLVGRGGQIVGESPRWWMRGADGSKRVKRTILIWIVNTYKSLVFDCSPRPARDALPSPMTMPIDTGPSERSSSTRCQSEPVCSLLQSTQTDGKALSQQFVARAGEPRRTLASTVPGQHCTGRSMSLFSRVGADKVPRMLRGRRSLLLLCDVADMAYLSSLVLRR